jgi:hypothetical protein
MKTIWTKGLEEDSAKEMKINFNGAAQLRKRLSIILNEKIATKDKNAMSDIEYENAGWAYKQADTQGYKRAMREILSII